MTYISLRLIGGVLRICDTSMYFDAWMDIELPNGDYAIQTVADEDGELQEILLGNGEASDQVDVEGELTLPFSQFGLFDKAVIDDCFQRMQDVNEYYSQLQSESDSGLISFTDDIQTPFFRCPEGSIVVYRLTRDSLTVGLKICMGYLEDGSEE